MWERSPTPEESWSDASGGNEDGEWPIEGIVGEEIRLDGTPRYEVRWGNWSRADGSNTTWQSDIPDRHDLVNRWKRIQSRKRATLAENDLDMDVPWKGITVHQRLTHQRAQAYEEKKQRRFSNLPSTANWDEEVENEYRRLQDRSAEDNGPPLRVRRNTNVAPQPSLRRGRTSSPGQSILSREIPSQPSSSVNSPRRSRPRIDTSISSSPQPGTSSSAAASLQLGSKPSSSSEPCLPYSIQILRSRMERAWTRAARDVMAVGVRIDRNIADKNIPSDLSKFKYIEKGYLFDDGLQEQFHVPRDVFTICDCSQCLDASHCSCQAISDILDPLQRKTYAYSQGLFTFNVPQGTEVIECNKFCGCGPRCQNRVAQQPRDIEIEIFDTKRCGWGARTLGDIPKGKVLGTYTGKVIRREDVDALPEDHYGYLFDLDGTEIKDEENLGSRYTVDSYAHGNWTRFVNHSCNPNMVVYSVVYDTIPDVNMPYVAFVTCQEVAAGTELTINYQPHLDEDFDVKYKHGAERCKCGSKPCRGWYRI
ncbi:hypothetical protein PISMIDRAFT_154171 [Pisolithus microcarpus 441]|uniref:Histone-lysine N-methyltransferase n=1 Tax=Pisolithus microcarpus 441 TaxID=765257 RepID=A0A0C9Z9Z2_9AGAM|nr:hypothetical protein PISMIDRAFT_154171 [Pisolithus microcarpus 441]